MYADVRVGPPSIKSHSHEISHEPIIHIVDDDRVEYAQINKHKLCQSQKAKNKPDGMSTQIHFYTKSFKAISMIIV